MTVLKGFLIVFASVAVCGFAGGALGNQQIGDVIERDNEGFQPVGGHGRIFSRAR